MKGLLIGLGAALLSLTPRSPLPVGVAESMAATPAISSPHPSPRDERGRAVRNLPYSPSVTGEVAGFRLAGIEPDGDPLNQVVLRTRLAPSGNVPALNLIVNTYLENFKPDTTPILPDLLHPRQTAQNLGGFLQGKALLTDDAGNVLYIGSFLAEAFLDNSNHAVMQRFYGTGPAFGGSARLKGTFNLSKNGALHGAFSGRVHLPAAARRAIEEHRGARMKKLEQVIGVVTVKPAAMVGRATARSRSVPLHTGYGNAPKSAPARASRKMSPLTIIAGAGAVLSLLIGAYLFWSERRQARRTA